MAIQKKKTSMLQQGADEAAKAEREAARIKMKEEMQGGVGGQPTLITKGKTKAQQIKNRRPKQVGIHFTEEEKYAMEDARTLAKRLGLPNATVEDFCHSLIVAGLRSIENNNDLLLRIMQEDTTLTIS